MRDHSDSETKKKKKKKKARNLLDNADPTKLTATEKAKLKKKKLKAKKAKAARELEIEDEDESPAGLYFDTSESDEEIALDIPIHRYLDSDDDEDEEKPKKKKKKLKDGKKKKKKKKSVARDGIEDEEITGPDTAESEHDEDERVSTSTSPKALAQGSAPKSATFALLGKKASTNPSGSSYAIPRNANSIVASSVSIPSSVTDMLARLGGGSNYKGYVHGADPLEADTQELPTNPPAVPVPAAQLPSTHVSASASVTTTPSQAQTVPAGVQSPSTPAGVSPTPAATPATSGIMASMSAQNYTELPPEERVAKLAAEGLSNEQIALRTKLSLRTVMDLRKKSSAKSLIGDPRKLFAERLGDFDHAFQVARGLYHDDPASETNYRVMAEFAKTMRDLVKDYNDLDDPRETAMLIASRSLQPMVERILKSVVDKMQAALKAVAPYMREQERTLLADNIRVGMKTLQDAVNADYNNAVVGLEQTFGVDLTEIKITNAKPPAIHAEHGEKLIENKE